MKDTNDLTILVLSCDKYHDLWKPFFYCLHKYWKNCPCSIVLGSNTINSTEKRIQTILSGPDADWSTSLRKILSQIKTRYVFLWLDDIFLIHRVNTGDFADALEFMKRRKANHMHMRPTPQPDDVITGGKYGMYKKGAPYRANALGFWNTKYLTELLVPGENAWEFEIMGSYRTSYTDGFYCSMETLFKNLHVVEKGRIFAEANDYCIEHEIPLDVRKREVLAGSSVIRSILQKIYFNVVVHVPWPVRVAWMNVLRKAIVSY